MRISIFGLGYVGSVSAACFAREGNHVIGIDPNKTKVDIINEKRSPVIEKDLEELISEGVKTGFLEATMDGKYSLLNSEISFICVGTPSNPNGSLNTKYVERVASEIGGYLKHKNDYHIIVIRSSVLPGTSENIIIPTLEEYSQKKINTDFGVVVNPEFLRESSAVSDFYNPPKTVIGSQIERDAVTIAQVYSKLNAPLFITSLRIAELVKYADNAFHALKVAFSNEIGNLSKVLGVDSHEVMNIFCQDTKLNISPCYLKPGFAFGGSCLPKDLRALIYKAKTLDVEVPVLNAILPSNERQIKNAFQRVLSLGKKRVGVLGFAFKAGTDDLRESPVVELIELLLGKGLDLKIYDKEVSLAKLFGSNKEFIENRIPHISELMVENLDEIINHAEIIIIGNNGEEFAKIFPSLKKDQYIVDLIGASRKIETQAYYEGICW